MRHGASAPGPVDRARTLTPEGEAAVAAVAARAAARGMGADHVYHSGYLRARQTATILARALGIEHRVAVREGLQPDDHDVQTARWLLGEARHGTAARVALVSHMPFLGRLLGRLVESETTAPAVAFDAGTLVKLVSSTDASGFRIDWVLSPDRE